MVRLLLLILLIQPSEAITPASDEEQLLRRGRELEQSGQYKQALQVWEGALTELQTPSLAVGREYIRLVGELRLSLYYETASAMYLWGLSSRQVESNEEALQEELSMLEPLVEKERFRLWKKLYEELDPGLYEEIQLFWQNRDPTPATVYNERLIEHWERIAYAREHFTRDDEPPYGTDDRGKFWVRYGKPDRQYDGWVKLTKGEAMRMMERLHFKIDRDDMRALANAAVLYHENPSYEFWIYRQPDESMEYNLVLIFGDKSSGGFSRVETIDDLIPARAFQFSNRHDSGFNRVKDAQLTPGMIMRWIYYEQLVSKDFYFADQFDRMVFEWDRVDPDNPYLGEHAGLLHKQQTQRVTNRNLEKAPEEQSTYQKEFPAIPLEPYQYRLLDEQGRTVFATFLESRPQPVFVEDLAANQEMMGAGGEAFRHYRLLHGLQLKDREGRILTQTRLPADLLLDSTNTEPSSSVFTVPYVPGGTRQVLFAELHNRHPYSRPQVESPFPQSLRGLGKIEIPQPEPLSTDPGQLEMGDLILGYQMRAEPEVSESALFPFVVANDRQISVDQDLAVHVEVYHLQDSPNGIARFQLSYQILPVNFLGWTKEQRQQVSLTLNLETDRRRYTEDLEIKTRQLAPGRYVLRMQATDPVEGQLVRREIEFEVVETPKSKE